MCARGGFKNTLCSGGGRETGSINTLREGRGDNALCDRTRPNQCLSLSFVCPKEFCHVARGMKPSLVKIYEVEKVSKPIRLSSQMVGGSPLAENKNEWI